MTRRWRTSAARLGSSRTSARSGTRLHPGISGHGAKGRRAAVRASRNIERQIVVQRDMGQRDALAEAQEELAGARAAAARLQNQVLTGRRKWDSSRRASTSTSRSRTQLGPSRRRIGMPSKRLAPASTRASAPACRRPSCWKRPRRRSEPSRPLYWRDTGLCAGASLALAPLTMWLVERFNRSEPQPTMILVHPRPAGLLNAGDGRVRCATKARPAMSLEGTSPALLPGRPVFPRELGHG